MFSWHSIPRLTVRALFAVFIFNSSAWLVGRTVYVAEYLLAEVGAPEWWRILHAHPFGRSIAVGILAALIPLQLWLTLSGFIRASVPEFLEKLQLDRMKPWVVVLYSPIFAVALVGWIVAWFAMRARTMTILQDSTAMPVWRMFDGFFSESCRNVSDNRLDLWNDNFRMQCNVHVLTISMLLMAAGYSLAPLIRSRIPDESWAEDAAIGETTQQEDDITDPITTDEKAL
jgi:hypothetical protein